MPWKLSLALVLSLAVFYNQITINNQERQREKTRGLRKDLPSQAQQNKPSQTPSNKP